MGALVILGIAVVVAPGARQADGLVPLFVVLIVVPVVVPLWLRRRPLRSEDATGLRVEYATRLSVMVGSAQAAAALAFGGVLFTGYLWLLLLGAAVVAWIVVAARPTDERIAAHDARLRERGSPTTLSDALDE